MTQLARIISQAQAAGIDPAAECTDAGMAICLNKADNLGLLTFKAGAEMDWLDSMRLWCHEHSRQPMSFQEIAAAVLQLSVDADEAFLRPKQLWTAIAVYRQRQIGKALKGANGPEIPADVAGEPAHEIAYRQAWMAFAAISGDAQDADRQARAALQLPAQDKPRQLAPMPENLKQRFKNLPKGLRK